MQADSLGQRMKEYYEAVPKLRLIRRMPVALRLDGRSFHTFTKGFRKPFEPILCGSMQDTMEYLCRNIQNCVFGYTQSDEITLILVDYETFDTSAWFDYEVQKLVSVAAAMATMKFNRVFNERLWQANFGRTYESGDMKWINSMLRAAETGAVFDCRCFNIPKEEVANLILWRQQDAMKNSIQMVAREYFSNAELHKKDCATLRQMLLDKGMDWDSLPGYQKVGSACYRKTDNGRSRWYMDMDMPVLKGEAAGLIDRLIYVGEE